MLWVYPARQLSEQKSLGAEGKSFGVFVWFFCWLVVFLLSLSDHLFYSLSMNSNMLFILSDEDLEVILNDLQLFCVRRERHANLTYKRYIFLITKWQRMLQHCYHTSTPTRGLIHMHDRRPPHGRNTMSMGDRKWILIKHVTNCE